MTISDDDTDDENFDWDIDEDDDSVQYKDEIKAFQRVGLPGDILKRTVGPDGKIDRSIQDPLERFQIYVDASARNLMGENISINEGDIKIMIEKAINLKYVHFKNPNAYILGYIASNGGKNITQKTFDYATNNALPLIIKSLIDKGSIRPPDVLRYARLWSNL